MNFEKQKLQIAHYAGDDGPGVSYSFIHLPNTDKNEYILFLHGFPSLPEDFHGQITYFAKAGYGIVAPELLGYGDTSRPVESQRYRLKLMASDMVAILDHLKIREVIGVGHDWGVTLLSRLEFYYPERIDKMALLTIGAAPVGQPFDLDKVNAMMKEKLGYEGFGYMAFATRDPDAADVLNSHQESFRSLQYQSDPEVCKRHLGAVGGLRDWLLKDQRAEHVLSGFDKQLQAVHQVAFAEPKGGYTGTLNWYVNHVFNTNVPDEQTELEKRGTKTYQTSKPVLHVLAKADPISLPPIHQQMTSEYAPNATFETVDAGHWVMLEASQALNQALHAFFNHR